MECWELPFDLFNPTLSTLPFAMADDDSRGSAPVPADQMRTTNGRRKVALAPGRSQLDWMRDTRKITRRAPRPVTMQEVSQHKEASDAWLVVENIVYNVTPYLEYHPGGVPILLSSAGKVSIRLCTI